MLIEISGAPGACRVDPTRVLVPAPGSRAARAWFERGPPCDGSAADEPELAEPLPALLERPSPATARRGWVVIPGGARSIR